MANFPNSEGRKVVLAQVQTILDNKAYLSEVDGRLAMAIMASTWRKDFNSSEIAWAKKRSHLVTVSV
jgi:hypothetical protein